jgi:hypothetical protein
MSRVYEDRGRVGRGDRVPFGGGVTDYASVLALLYLAAWWLLMPSLEAVKSTDKYDSFFVGPWAWTPLIPAVLLGVVLGFIPRLRDGFFPPKLRFAVPLVVVGLAALMIFQAPRIYAYAQAIRNEVEIANLQLKRLNKLKLKDAIDRAKTEGKTELAAALESAQKKKDEEVKRLKDEQAAAQKKAADALEKAEQKGEDAVGKLHAEQQARIDAERRADQIARDKPITVIEPPITPGTTAPPPGAKKGPPAPPPSGDDAAPNVVAAAIALGLMNVNPILAAALAQVLGISFGTEHKLMQEVGTAVQNSFPGGKFDPAKAEAEIQRLASLADKSDRVRVLKAYKMLLERMKKEVGDKDKAGVQDAITKTEKSLEEATREAAVEDTAIRDEVEKLWGTVVKEKKANELEEVLRRVREVMKIPPHRLRAIVADVARKKGVTADEINKFDKPASQ